MAATVRLPIELQAEAMAYAERLGLSLNGLIAVALRDYLDGRRRLPADLAAPAPVAPLESVPDPEPEPERSMGKPAAQRPAVLPPPRRYDRCTCGSGRRYDKCCGKQLQR
jgi:hypothetical protein